LTPGFATQPAGYSTYWQYTTALAFSVLAATNPVISSADMAIESFILGLLRLGFSKMIPRAIFVLMQDNDGRSPGFHYSLR
jgi:hypothetical protein